MKKTLLSLMLASTLVCAEEVTVTGYGINYNTALENAKVSALEKGASTFIIGERYARNNRVTEEIDQYNGGVIKRYDILSHSPSSTGYEVTITADVVPKNNTIVKSKTPFNVDFEDYDKREKIVQKLDNISTAIYARIEPPVSKIGRYETTISTNVVLAWQPKWITDMKAFASVVNDAGSTGSNLKERAVGNGVLALVSHYGLIGALAGTALNQATTPHYNFQQNNNMMICFDIDSCSNINVDMTFPVNPKLVFTANVNGRSVILHEMYLDIKLYRYIPSGQSIQPNSLFKSYKVTFKQPALLINETTQNIPLTFNVNNDIIRSVSSVNVFLK